MTRNMDADDLADAIERADRPSWRARLVRRAVVKGGPFAAAAVAVSTALHLAHVDTGGLLMPMVWAGPFIAVAVASFVAHAWRQNSTTPVYGTGYVPGLAEPGQVDQAQPGLAKPVVTLPPATVTVTGVTALPGPTAALPHAAGQTRPIHYPAPLEEEEPRA